MGYKFLVARRRELICRSLFQLFCSWRGTLALSVQLVDQLLEPRGSKSLIGSEPQLTLRRVGSQNIFSANRKIDYSGDSME